jgi:hypothetical protein
MRKRLKVLLKVFIALATMATKSTFDLCKNITIYKKVCYLNHSLLNFIKNTFIEDNFFSKLCYSLSFNLNSNNNNLHKKMRRVLS